MKENLKVYHGLPKTPTNEKTVLYASFNGSLQPEIGGPFVALNSSETQPTIKFTPSITNYGLNCSVESNKSYYYTDVDFDEYLTIDFWDSDGYIRFASAPNSELGTNNNTYALNKLQDRIAMWGGSVNCKEIYHDSTKLNHFRFIIKKGTSVTYYLNGVKQMEEFLKPDWSKVLQSPLRIHLFSRHGHGSYPTNSHVGGNFCDLHVVKDNLGDCFPTLPQDFIDGKAIVVPALNQRQSYGDPVLHQVTELLVPYATSENNPYSNVPVNGLYTHKTKPELSVNGADLWGTNSKIRIKGLDTTFITGVIDTDTAKCKVTSTTEAGSTITIPVDNTSGLVVGDTLWVYNSTMTSQWDSDPNYYIEVKAIDSVNKTITVQSNYPSGIRVTAGDLLIETTTSSSSPIVKTVDGVTVNGTWSGLGTTSATFTFGDNSNIAGKDLVVTYCLNARGNSSPYPKMPSEVIRGYNELGHELVPANEIVIQDDFRGKVSGSNETCPHTLSWNFSTNFSGFGGTEFVQHRYNSLNDPSDYIQSITSKSGERPNHIVSIDLIRLVEDKFGCEIPGNKLNWLKNNISVTTCYFDCYGWLQGSNYYVEARYYMPDNKNWSTNSGTSHRHSESDFKYIHVNGGAGVIDSEGKIHFLVTTNASNGSASYLRVKDIYFKVTFTKSDIYDYLYPKNTHARFGEKGNPILVDKQTKEVKRLLPSTAPFSTEVLLHSPTKQDTRFEDLEILHDHSYTYITTQGTGTSCPTYDVFRGLVAKLDISALFPHKLLGENLFNIPVTNAVYRSSKIKRVLSQPYPSNFNFDSVEDAYEVDSVYFSPRLVQYGKEVYLYVLAYQLDCTNRRGAITQVIYKLPNRPLIK